ncbi:MFS transporter [Thalassospira sp. MA62]|nr:MFS transporter [Thalassospira sp. MA62]
MTWRIVTGIGIAQLISWGTAYYLIGNLGTALADHNGWDSAIIYGGFSSALLVMGLTSSAIGRLIDHWDGRPVMMIGAALNALGCLTLAFADQVFWHFVGWVVLGIAMRATLYDAAFAALARTGLANAGRMMGQITLFGGLASTVFWPLGHYIESHFGVVIALIVYAGFAILSIPLHLALPSAPRAPAQPQDFDTPALNPSRDHVAPCDHWRCGVLYAVIVSILNTVNAAMSAHMVPILMGLGLASAVAIEAASLRGIGQSLSRGCEVLFGSKLRPTSLTVIAMTTLPMAFVAALFGGEYMLAAMVFTFVYGAANGVLTITRGTLPLMIFGTNRYGQHVGRLLFPGFILSALAPSLFERLISHFGPLTAIWTAGGLLVIGLGCAIALQRALGPETLKP